MRKALLSVGSGFSSVIFSQITMNNTPSDPGSWPFGFHLAAFFGEMKNPDAPKVIKTVVRAAYDDNHKKQTAAQKILMGRMLPISPLNT